MQSMSSQLTIVARMSPLHLEKLSMSTEASDNVGSGGACVCGTVKFRQALSCFDCSGNHTDIGLLVVLDCTVIGYILLDQHFPGCTTVRILYLQPRNSL